LSHSALVIFLNQRVKRESQHRRARKAIDSKDFKAAVGHLTKAVQEEPKNADAHSMLVTATESSHFDKSMGTIRRRSDRFSQSLRPRVLARTLI